MAEPLTDKVRAHPSDRAGGLRPEPLCVSAVPALIPCAYRAEQHPSGWWEVTDGQRPIDDSGDGGFTKRNAEIIAAALTAYGVRLNGDWSTADDAEEPSS